MEWRGATEVFHQLWDQALVAVTSAEEEATRLVGRVQATAGWSQEEAIRQARAYSDRLAAQRRDIERRIDEAAQATTARLRVPRREDVATLSARLESLTKRVEALTR
jgi:polyhydroxyalkanoate synthesis regulator phasin